MRLLICSTYPHLPDVVGGLQTSTDELCQTLSARGIEPIVLCGVDFGHRHEGAPPGPIRSDVSFGYRVLRTTDPIAALPTVASSLEPTAIIAQTGLNFSRLLSACLGTGYPTAAYLHNVELQNIGMLTSHPSLLYIANSQFTADRLRAAYGIDSMILPPVILPERYIGAAAKDGRTGNRVLFVNPVPHKGVEIAFALAQARPHIPFTFVESWQIPTVARDAMLRRAGPLTNIGWQPSTRNMAELLGDTRILLMPSVWEEAFGRTAVEAQLNGIPVLASNRGGLPEAVGDGGLLLDPHVPTEIWAAALDQIYALPDMWAEEARQNAWAMVTATRLALDNVLMRLAMHRGHTH